MSTDETKPGEDESGLTGFPPSRDSRSLTAMLDAAGLELWQAPEGFWAVRVKPVAVTAATAARPARRRARGGR